MKRGFSSSRQSTNSLIIQNKKIIQTLKVFSSISSSLLPLLHGFACNIVFIGYLQLSIKLYYQILKRN